MNQQEMMDLRRQHAKQTNQGRWSINALPPSNESKAYKQGSDKDGLSKEQRLRVEAVKDRLTYGVDDYSEVWDK